MYLGKHLSLHTSAAIKVLNDRPKKEKLERFRTEAYITAKLSHRHIVQVFDYDEKSSPPFLIMEYAPNGSLETRYRGVKLPLPTIVSYVKQISGALYYAHSRGVIHCDVKPDNMLLDANDDVLVTDFGIAVITAEHTPIPRIFGGTATYIAPEQYRGRPLPASDQFSLGIMVYEWLSGYPPFFGSSSEIAMQHLNVSPRVMAPRTPPAVQRVVLRALEKDPEQRFPNIQSFADAFEQACEPKAKFLKRNNKTDRPPKLAYVISRGPFISGGFNENSTKKYLYDVALSFAGEDREHANALAVALRHRQLNVFYDEYEKTTLWGKNLYDYLSDIYQNKAQYCVMFLSEHDAVKLWTNHERKSAQACAFEENGEYILPVRLDSTNIPGISPTIAYLSWPPETAETIADMLLAKLGKIPPST